MPSGLVTFLLDQRNQPRKKLLKWVSPLIIIIISVDPLPAN